MSVNLKVNTPDELRDALSTSGVFEMLDCEVYIESPGDVLVTDVERMVTILHSTINITDINVTYVIDADEYTVRIIEVPLPVAEGKIK